MSKDARPQDHLIVVHRPARIISGGQTGADRAALDVAIALGIPHGGYVPAGRRAEDGTIPNQYNMTELPTDSYDKRTERNVMESDATLIVSLGPLTGGSAATRHYARRHDKAMLHVDLARTAPDEASAQIREWLDRFRPATLNVAGPRESTTPGIYAVTRQVLEKVLRVTG